MKVRYVLGPCALLMASAAFAQAYKWVDENGVTHFSDANPGTGHVETVHPGHINSIDSVSYDWVRKPEVAAARGKVVMYGTSWCKYCAKARKYFHEQGIRYTDYDIEKNQAAKKRYDEIGGRGVPVILVGKRRMNGFSESGFQQIYRR